MTFKPYKGKVLLRKIQELITQNRFRTSTHFQLREKQRVVFLWEALHVLKNGHHEEERDEWDHKYQTWSYAIKGRTMEARELCIVISFLDNDDLILITVYDLNNKVKHGKKD